MLEYDGILALQVARKIGPIIAGIILAGTICGCGRQANLAPVSGKVTLDGRPLTSGSVMFAPIAAKSGRPAFGDIQPDGTFMLGTYAKTDGALMGKHMATIYGKSNDKQNKPSPPGDNSVPTQVATKPPFALIRLVDRQYEVKADADNNITIELTTQLIRMFGEKDD